MLAKIHHSILQSWPVTTASIAMPKLEEGAGQAKLSQARGVERILHSTHPFCQVEDRFFCVCPTRDIHYLASLYKLVWLALFESAF